MQVAVARMEHVHHQQIVALGDLVDVIEYLGQLASRHHRVVQVVVGFDASDGTERCLAALPEQRSFGFVLRHPHGARAVRFGDSDDALYFVVQPVRQTVYFDQQDGRCVDR